MSISQSWLETFREIGAVWEYRPGGPHACFETAALHTDFYFNTEVAANHPQLVERISADFFDLCAVRKFQPRLVISYNGGIADGSAFAAGLALRLSVEAGCVDLERKEVSCQIRPGDAVLVVADDIVSGGSLAKTVDFIKAAGGQVYASVLTLGNLSGKSSLGGYEVLSLFERPLTPWTPDACPLCKQGSPVLKARSEWRQLKTS